MSKSLKRRIKRGITKDSGSNHLKGLRKSPKGGDITQGVGIITQETGVIIQEVGIITQEAGVITQEVGVIIIEGSNRYRGWWNQQRGGSNDGRGGSNHPRGWRNHPRGGNNHRSSARISGCLIQVCTNSHRPAFCWKLTQRSVIRLLLLVLLLLLLLLLLHSRHRSQLFAETSVCHRLTVIIIKRWPVIAIKNWTVISIKRRSVINMKHCCCRPLLRHHRSLDSLRIQRVAAGNSTALSPSDSWKIIPRTIFWGVSVIHYWDEGSLFITSL